MDFCLRSWVVLLCSNRVSLSETTLFNGTWLTEWNFRILILHIFRLAKKKRKTEEKTEVQKTPAHRQNKKEQTSAKKRVLLAELENQSVNKRLNVTAVTRRFI